MSVAALAGSHTAFASSAEVAASAEAEEPGTTPIITASSHACITLTAFWAC